MLRANATLNYINKYSVLKKVKKIEKFLNLTLKFHKFNFVSDTRFLGAIGVMKLRD